MSRVIAERVPRPAKWERPRRYRVEARYPFQATWRVESSHRTRIGARFAMWLNAAMIPEMYYRVVDTTRPRH